MKKELVDKLLKEFINNKDKLLQELDTIILVTADKKGSAILSIKYTEAEKDGEIS